MAMPRGAAMSTLTRASMSSAHTVRHPLVRTERSTPRAINSSSLARLSPTRRPPHMPHRIPRHEGQGSGPEFRMTFGHL